LIPHVLPVYNRSSLSFTHGKGVWLYAENGRKYLDFAAGIAVNALGYSHPKLVRALTRQAKKFWHLSNLYQIPGLDELAGKLTGNTFADTVFFCNSGAEAVECGIKMVRKYFDEIGQPKRYRIITFKGSFHGRTLATISAAGEEKLLKGFEPEVDGFDHVPFLDIEAVKNAINPKTAAILIEPIQGEGGIRVAPKEFLQNLRKICDENELLLFLDEIQSGMGRSGKLFAHELAGIKPDIVAAAKGIGGGFPLGACLANEKAAQGMKPGSHGSTYGSNPLAMAVGNAVMDTILKSGFLKNVVEKGEFLKSRLEGLQKLYPSIIKEVRGVGLMLGLKVVGESKDFTAKLRDLGLLTAPASDNVVRILPPLIVENEHIYRAVELIGLACAEIKK